MKCIGKTRGIEGTTATYSLTYTVVMGHSILLFSSLVYAP